MGGDISALLKELRYYPLSEGADKIFSASIRDALDKLGESVSTILLSYMSSLHGLSESEFLRNYRLVAEGLRNTLGEGADVILSLAKENMLQHTAIKNPNLTIEEIMNHINQEKILESVRQLTGHEHIILLYKTDDFKDRILREFLKPDWQAPKGLVSAEPTKLGVSNLLYDEILQAGRSEAMKKISGWINKLHSVNKSSYATRIVDENCTWYFKNNLGAEHLKLEESLGRSGNASMSVICGYKISEPADENMVKSIIRSHGYVILEEPSLLFKEGSVR